MATTLRAKGAFPEDHPLSLGVFGYAGTHHSRMALPDAPPDLLLVLGSGLNERDSMHWTLKLAPERTICVNLSATVLGSHLNGSCVLGDSGAYLEWLSTQGDRIGPTLDATRVARGEWLAGIEAQPRLQDAEHCASDAVPIHPARAISELREALPREGIVLIDSGAHRAFAGHYWTAYRPGSYISATNLGPMGWAIPAAVGVQCARPDRKVAVITGDGCMRMHGIEIAVAARYQMPIIYLVINNAALGKETPMARLHFDPGQLDPKDKSIYEEMVAQRKSQGAPFGGPYAALMNYPALCQKIEAQDTRKDTLT